MSHNNIWNSGKSVHQNARPVLGQHTVVNTVKKRPRASLSCRCLFPLPSHSLFPLLRLLHLSTPFLSHLKPREIYTSGFVFSFSCFRASLALRRSPLIAVVHRRRSLRLLLPSELLPSPRLNPESSFRFDSISGPTKED